MKKLENLSEKVPLIEAMEPNASPQVIKDMELAKENSVTLRRLLLQQVCAPRAKDEEEAIQVWQIGLKIRSAGDACELEDGEFALVCKRVKENPLGWVGHTQGWVAMKLQEVVDKDREFKKIRVDK